MLKVIAFGLATGAGIQAWRNFPPDGPVSADMLALVMVVGVVSAFLGGLWFGRGGGRATATATATASASVRTQQAVNVFNVIPGAGARPMGVVVPDETASWIQGNRPALELDQLDGLDVEELLSDRDTDESESRAW